MKLLVLMILSFLLFGCVLSTKPNNDLGFVRAKSLFSFDGCYENHGEAAPGEIAPYLSGNIWPKSKLEHTNIDAVLVKALNERSISVIAYSHRQILRQDTFFLGKDFEFESGLIKISHVMGSAATESGNPFIGAALGTTELGVDSVGNGRLQDSATFVGTAFLIIPVAGNVSQAARFKKSEVLCSIGS